MVSWHFLLIFSATQVEDSDLSEEEDGEEEEEEEELPAIKPAKKKQKQ